MGALTATPTLITDVKGTYEVTLTVSDFLGPGVPATVTIVATTRGDYSIGLIREVGAIVDGLLPGQVTNGGNQKAFGNLLQKATALIQQGDLAGAIDKLDQAIQRTDGCPLRGSPDGKGSGRDWITDCGVQAVIYPKLMEALASLQN